MNFMMVKTVSSQAAVYETPCQFALDCMIMLTNFMLENGSKKIGQNMKKNRVVIKHNCKFNKHNAGLWGMFNVIKIIFWIKTTKLV